MAEASDRLTVQRRRRLSIYVGRWEATPRWFFWKPKWRRRVLEYKSGFRTDADYVWQYAAPIKLVNFEAQPSLETREAQSWVEAQPPLAATEAESLTELQTPPEATAPVEAPPPETTKARSRTELQSPLEATEAASRVETQPPLEPAEAESPTELKTALEATEAQSQVEAQPLLEATEAESLTELQPPTQATAAESRIEAQPLSEATAAESPTELQTPPEAADLASQTEPQPPPATIDPDPPTELQTPSEAADAASQTEPQPPPEAAEAESRIRADEDTPSDQPISPPPGAPPGPGESDRAVTSGRPAEKTDEDASVHRADEEGRRRRRRLVLPAALLVIALLIAAGVYYWWSTRNIESTDDAYTDGRAITIAPQVAGEVISLDVNDNEFVKQGQALIHIDPRQYKNDRDQAEGALATAKAQHSAQQLAAEIAHKNFPALLDQAKAQLESAKANLAKTQADYRRQISLQRPATTQQDVDQAATARWQAEAQVKLAEAQVKQNSPVSQQISQSEAQVRQRAGDVEQAEARLHQAELNLSWTTVAVPQDGWITKRNVEKGNYVIAGQQILSIVTPEVWVTANFKETQLTYMRPGQPVKIRVDAYPALDLRGHVDSIQRGSGSKFTAFPPENATGNFVKIVQRVPVKIVIDSGLPQDIPMPLGISVIPTVTVR